MMVGSLTHTQVPPSAASSLAQPSPIPSPSPYATPCPEHVDTQVDMEGNNRTPGEASTSASKAFITDQGGDNGPQNASPSPEAISHEQNIHAGFGSRRWDSRRKPPKKEEAPEEKVEVINIQREDAEPPEQYVWKASGEEFDLQFDWNKTEEVGVIPDVPDIAPSEDIKMEHRTSLLEPFVTVPPSPSKIRKPSKVAPPSPSKYTSRLANEVTPEYTSIGWATDNFNEPDAKWEVHDLGKTMESPSPESITIFDRRDEDELVPEIDINRPAVRNNRTLCLPLKEVLKQSDRYKDQTYADLRNLELREDEILEQRRKELYSPEFGLRNIPPVRSTDTGNICPNKDMVSDEEMRELARAVRKEMEAQNKASAAHIREALKTQTEIAREKMTVNRTRMGHEQRLIQAQLKEEIQEKKQEQMTQVMQKKQARQWQRRRRQAQETDRQFCKLFGTAQGAMNRYMVSAELAHRDALNDHYKKVDVADQRRANYRAQRNLRKEIKLVEAQRRDSALNIQAETSYALEQMQDKYKRDQKHVRTHIEDSKQQHQLYAPPGPGLKPASQKPRYPLSNVVSAS